jgi:hypothetical protein
MEPISLIAGLAFEPHVKGILIVVVSAAILMGSMYLIIATNTGSRLGLLIAGAGFFGWMVIMGFVWWIYGIGLKGNTPTWHVLEVNVAHPSQAQTEEVRTLPAFDELPSTASLLDAHPDLFPAEEYEATDNLSDLAVAPGACALLADNDYGGWRLAPVSALGEPQAVADAVLANEGFFSSPSGYKVLNGFELGGKDDLRTCPEDSADAVERVTHFVKTLPPTHPPHYFVLQVQPVITQEARPGEAPPRPTVDPTKPVLNVVMVRDLGNLRFPPAMTTLGSLVIFCVLVSMLNRRDRLVQQHLAEAP